MAEQVSRKNLWCKTSLGIEEGHINSCCMKGEDFNQQQQQTMQGQAQQEMECPSVVVVTSLATTFTNHVVVATHVEVGLAKPSEKSYLTHF